MPKLQVRDFGEDSSEYGAQLFALRQQGYMIVEQTGWEAVAVRRRPFSWALFVLGSFMLGLPAVLYVAWWAMNRELRVELVHRAVGPIVLDGPGWPFTSPRRYPPDLSVRPGQRYQDSYNMPSLPPPLWERDAEGSARTADVTWEYDR